MRTFDEIEQERERNIEADGYTPDLLEAVSVGPTGDGLHGRYAVVAVYVDAGRDERRKVITRWATLTRAERIARILARNNKGRFAFIGVLDEVEDRWVAKLAGDT